MKNILCYIDELGPGGAERQITSLAALLRKSGYPVKVYCYHPNYFYEDYLVCNDVELIKVELKKNDYINKIRNTCSVISKYNFDTIISYSEGPNVIASLIKVFRPSLNVIVSERNTTQCLTLKEKLRFFLYRFVDSIVANSFSQTNFIKGTYPKLQNKTFTITNYIDTTKFHPAEINITDSKVKFIVVARHSAQKNVPRFIEAINLLKNKNLPFYVDWYGDDGGGCKQEHVELSEKYGLNNYLQFHPSASNIQDYYRKADVFCLPSLYEGFPNVLCEAMSSGLPVICSDVCDNPTLIENNVNGLLFNPKDPQSIAKAIESIVGMSSEQRRTIGRRNRVKAEHIFSEATFVNSYIKLIEWPR